MKGEAREKDAKAHVASQLQDAAKVGDGMLNLKNGKISFPRTTHACNFGSLHMMPVNVLCYFGKRASLRTRGKKPESAEKLVLKEMKQVVSKHLVYSKPHECMCLTVFVSPLSDQLRYKKFVKDLPECLETIASQQLRNSAELVPPLLVSPTQYYLLFDPWLLSMTPLPSEPCPGVRAQGARGHRRGWP